MPEGDTLWRTAAGLRPYLVGRTITAARANGPGPLPRIARIVGARIAAVEARGKNLLIVLDGGLELRTHLGMHGSWHRYAPGERWRRPPSRARLVLEVPGAVAVCFDAPTVELLGSRAEALHPVLASLGPDLLAGEFDAAEARRRLRDPSRASMAVSEALLDQRALAGIGNVFKNEVLWLERVDPFATVGSLDDATLDRLVATARRLLVANIAAGHGPGRVTTGLGARPGATLAVDGPGAATAHPVAHHRHADGPLWVYGRRARPCRRCGTPIRSRRHGDRPRVTYWCPHCQGDRT